MIVFNLLLRHKNEEWCVGTNPRLLLACLQWQVCAVRAEDVNQHNTPP